MSRYERNEGDRSVVMALVRLSRRKEEIAAAVSLSLPQLLKFYPDEMRLLDPARYVPTDEDRDVVWRMAAFGFTQEQIARRLRLNIDQLTTHFREQLDNAYVEAIDEVAGNLKRIACGMSPQAVAAATFYLKTRAGWKETTVNEHTGKDGAPLAATINVTVGQQPARLEDASHGMD